MDGHSGGIRFFDCNMRIGRAGVVRPEHVLDAQGLLNEMEFAGIERALVYHVWSQEWDPGGGNRKLLEELGDCSRLHPCFVPLPEATGELGTAADFAADVKQGQGAVRLYPRVHGYSLQWGLGSTLKALAERQVPVLVEMAQTGWDELAWLLGEYPDLPVILLATSYRINRSIYPLFERFENLHLETATYQIMRGIEDVTRRFGAHRLVFGTGLPLLDAGGPIAQITYAELSDDEKAQIAGGTLARLLGVTDWAAGGAS